jgi:hypothetical protein
MGFREEVAAAVAVEIHDHFSDGWDFCDAVREETHREESLAKTAEAYLKEWGMLQEGYTIEDFRVLDRREGRV